VPGWGWQVPPPVAARAARWLCPISRQEFVQGIAVHKFHGDKGDTFGRLANVVNGADVRVIKGRRGLGFGKKPLPALLIAGQFGRQKLDRCLPTQPRILREKDFSHSSGANTGNDAVVANGIAGHEKCPRRVQTDLLMRSLPSFKVLS
jgi:hypothetical protein